MDNLEKIIEQKEKYLRGIVKYFPKCISPNLLTIARILLLPLIVILIIYGHFIWGLIIFILAFALDLLDGPLARLRKQTTDFGALLDPFADKIIFLTVLFLVTYQSLPGLMLFTILALELIIMIIAGVLAPLARKLKFKFKIGANKFGKYKMFFQFIGIIVLMINPQNEINIQIGMVIFMVAILFSALSIVDHCRSIKK